jgi:predicted  nucleic acid-binding Zn-ribbon protein
MKLSAKAFAVRYFLHILSLFALFAAGNPRACAGYRTSGEAKEALGKVEQQIAADAAEIQKAESQLKQDQSKYRAAIAPPESIGKLEKEKEQLEDELGDLESSLRSANRSMQEMAGLAAIVGPAALPRCTVVGSLPWYHHQPNCSMFRDNFLVVEDKIRAKQKEIRRTLREIDSLTSDWRTELSNLQIQFNKSTNRVASAKGRYNQTQIEIEKLKMLSSSLLRREQQEAALKALMDGIRQRVAAYANPMPAGVAVRVSPYPGGFLPPLAGGAAPSGTNPAPAPASLPPARPVTAIPSEVDNLFKDFPRQNPGQPVPKGLPRPGLMPERNAEVSWSDRASEAWARAREYTRQRLASVKTPDALSMLQKSKDAYLEKQLDYGAPTAESFLSEKVTASLNSLLGVDEPRNGGLLETARLELFKKSSEKAAEEVTTFARKKITEKIYNALEKQEPIDPDDPVAQAQREFEVASSPSTLAYHTFPFVGGKAIQGVREYFNEVHEKFWNYFDLSTDQLLRNAQKTE